KHQEGSQTPHVYASLNPNRVDTHELNAPGGSVVGSDDPVGLAMMPSYEGCLVNGSCEWGYTVHPPIRARGPTKLDQSGGRFSSRVVRAKDCDAGSPAAGGIPLPRSPFTASLQDLVRSPRRPSLRRTPQPPGIVRRAVAEQMEGDRQQLPGQRD